LYFGGGAPAAAALPEVYERLDERVEKRYSVLPKRVFAVVEVGGTQYKVTPNDVIVVEKLAGVDVNDKLQLQRVLLLGSQAETIIGRPYVPDATVTAAVEVRRQRCTGHAVVCSLDAC
jgi:large subunit ribosomal protein L21